MNQHSVAAPSAPELTAFDTFMAAKGDTETTSALFSWLHIAAPRAGLQDQLITTDEWYAISNLYGHAYSLTEPEQKLLDKMFDGAMSQFLSTEEPSEEYQVAVQKIRDGLHATLTGLMTTILRCLADYDDPRASDIIARYEEEYGCG